MLPILNIGPLAIQTPGLIILFGIWLGLSIAERKAGWFHVNGSDINNMAFAGLLAGVIGARLVFMVQYFSVFQANPASLFSLNIDMFDPLWGILIGIVVSGYFGWRKQLPLRESLDALTTALAIFTISFHLAQYASGDAYGTASNLPWAIEIWGARRHPVQIYETLAAILVLWLVWPRPRWLHIPGQRFLAFIGMSAGARLFLEGFRSVSPTWGGIHIVQVLAWLILAACLWVLNKLEAQQKRQRETA